MASGCELGPRAVSAQLGAAAQPPWLAVRVCTSVRVSVQIDGSGR